MLALFLGVALIAAWAFLWPSSASDDLRFNLGRLEQFPPGTVTSYDVRAGRALPTPRGALPNEDGFHLVRLADGEVLALLTRSPHLGHPIPWLPSFVFDSRQGWFRDPRHGETFDMAGVSIFGPAPRGMDRAAVEVRNGTVIVDLGDVAGGVQRSSGYEFQTGGDWGPLTPR